MLAIGALFLLAVTSILVGAIRRGSDEAEFRPAIEAVVSAARSEQVVLIGEIHHWGAEHRFLRQLMSDPGLRDVVDDIVVEFGNARFQRIVDAYIRGDPVRLQAVSRAWTQTTQGQVWAAPDYAAFFRTVRQQNQRFDPSRRLRILLGDPPIGRDGATKPGDLDLWILQRDIHFAAVIQKQVVARQRRALVIAGVGHVLRQPDPYPTLANLLEGRVPCSPDPVAVAAGINWCDDLNRFPPTEVHVIIPHTGFGGEARLEQRLAGATRPSIAQIEGTWLAELPLSTVQGRSHADRPWTLGQASDSYLLLPD